MNNLYISIGSVHNLVKNKKRNYNISYLKNLDLDLKGIELMFSKDDFPYFKLSEKNREWLLSLNHVSYHLDKNLPDCGFIKDLDNIIDYYIWHSDRRLSMLDLGLEDYKEIKHKFLLENLDSENIAMFYNLHPSINNLCCDISHTLSYDISYLESFITMNGTFIQQFHISNYKDGECHVPFYKDKNNQLRNIKKMIKDNNLLDKPFIMEYNFNSEEELLEEYEYIKNVFGEK